MSLSNAMGATGGPPKEIVICRDWDDLGDQAALSFVRFAQEAVSLRGRFSAALAGGATPDALPVVGKRRVCREDFLEVGPPFLGRRTRRPPRSSRFKLPSGE
ncbi:MAG: hypothetical protein MPW14_00675 [Candidatus Manganitrophus sp.]|nr:MAG: hypothetical protein MPW14_00675 [Candidatus Manganitrophus sp.]